MNTRTKIYIALGIAAVLAVGIFSGSAWSDHKVRKLELEVDHARQTANDASQNAATLERDAAVYKEKIPYLESQLAETGKQARKQDEQIKTQKTITDIARRDVERARSVRPGDASAPNVAELCRKLAALGHACDQ
jgi:septal ring factor EnvC (AmiA/AmiB activator)